SQSPHPLTSSLSYTTLFRSLQKDAPGWGKALEPVVASQAPTQLADVDPRGNCHDLLELVEEPVPRDGAEPEPPGLLVEPLEEETDRKSTRLNSSHLGISYAV